MELLQGFIAAKPENKMCQLNGKLTILSQICLLHMELQYYLHDVPTKHGVRIDISPFLLLLPLSHPPLYLYICLCTL